jgi:hypothetical protein
MEGPKFRAWLSIAGLLTVLGISLASASLSTAQDPVRLKHYLPTDTVFYVEVPSIGQALEAMKEHPFAVLVRDVEVKAFLKPVMNSIRQGEAQAKRMLGLTVDEIRTILSGRVEVAVLGVTELDGNAAPDWALHVQVGSAESRAHTLLDRLVELARADGAKIEKTTLGGVDAWHLTAPVSTYAFISRGAFLLATDRSLAEKFIAATPDPTGSLAQDPAFTAVADRVNAAGAHASYYLNLPAVFTLIKESAPAGELPQEVFDQLMDRLGLRSLRAMGGSLTFGPRGVTEILHVRTEGERKGLLALADATTPGLTLPASVSPKTIAYLGGKLDWLKTYDTLVDVVGEMLADLSPGELEQMDEWLDLAESGAWGFKLREGLLSALGDEYALSIGVPPPGVMIPDFVVTLKIRDKDKMSGLIEKLQTLVPSEKVKVSRRMIKGTPLHQYRIEGVPISPAVAVLDDVLVAGLFAPSVRRCVRGHATSLAENERFQDGIASIGLQDTRSVASLVYLDLRESFGYLYDTFGPMLSGMDPDRLPVDLDLALLPSTEALVRPFYPMVGASRVEKDGFTSVMLGPVTFTSLNLGFMAIGASLRVRQQEQMRHLEEARRVAAAEVKRKEAEPAGGVTLGLEAEDIEGGRGVKVLTVDQGSVAARSGLKAGDVIVSVDGRKASNVDVVAGILRKKRPGETLVLKIRRGESELTVPVAFVK